MSEEISENEKESQGVKMLGGAVHMIANWVARAVEIADQLVENGMGFEVAFATDGKSYVYRDNGEKVVIVVSDLSGKTFATLTLEFPVE
jgi:hypothetical protein